MDMDTLQDLIQMVDENNDGLMQVNEFCRFMHICEHADPKNPRSVLFYASDDDDSGTISPHEL